MALLTNVIEEYAETTKEFKGDSYNKEERDMLNSCNPTLDNYGAAFLSQSSSNGSSQFQHIILLEEEMHYGKHGPVSTSIVK